jgi:predicted site-specific integrase-resolvase
MVTRRKRLNPDAISIDEASTITGLSTEVLRRFRREGLLSRLQGRTTYSRREAQAIADDTWLSGVQAAQILGISHVRVSQLANAEKIPVHLTSSGKRIYRQRQIQVVANARSIRRRLR